MARSAVTFAGHVDGGPLLLLIVEVLVIGDSLAIVEALEAILLNGGKVDKDILATIFWSDETEPLVAEELDGAVERHGREIELVKLWRQCERFVIDGYD